MCKNTPHKGKLTPPRYYLITYVHRGLRDHPWGYHNQVIDHSPAAWVAEWSQETGGEFILLFALEINRSEYEVLRGLL